MTSQPHDKLFKKGIVADARNLRPLVGPHLPPGLAEALDLDGAVERPGSYMDPDLSTRFSDTLFEVDLAGRPAFLYLLLEHQSTPDPLMSARLLIYMARIWDRWRRDPANAAAQRLPAILPIVFFQGRGAEWRVPRDFHGLIDLPPGQLAAVGARLPSFRYALESVGDVADPAIRARGLTPLGTLALLLLKHARAGRFLASLRLLVDLVNALPHADDYQLVVRYIVKVADVESAAEVEDAFGDSLDPEPREAIVTLAERLHEQGLQQGLDGLRRLLLRQLQVRFQLQAVPAEVESRVAAADAAQLESWGERLLLVDTLADVFAEPPERT